MMTYLKRRFSSSDLQEDDGSNGEMQNSFMNLLGLNNSGVPQAGMPQQVGGNFQRPPSAGPTSGPVPPNSFQGNFMQAQGPQSQAQGPRRTAYTSAPASPTKSTSGLSFNTISSQISNTIKSSLFSASQQSYAKCKVLLVVDDPSTDWSKYFRGRKILNDYDIRVEQATFSELSVASFSEQGAIAEITQIRDGQRVSRSFKPDYVLLRQHIRDGSECWKDLVIALQYGCVPGVNNLHSVYNFQDKPWVFSQLVGIQQRLGHEQFPLIDQAYFPSHRDMERLSKRKESSLADASVSLKMMAPRFPLVVKVAHAYGGAGKLRVETQADLQDVSTLVGLVKAYATTEQFVDAKYDIRVQKIGLNYKAFIRKSISGNWKANIGANVLEKVPMNERFKMWIDECSQIFGGLDICAVEMVQGKDGQPHIIDICGSSMPLLGETQEEDRRLIADLVYAKMQQFYSKSTSVPKAASLHHVHTMQNSAAPEYTQQQPTPQQFQPTQNMAQSAMQSHALPQQQSHQPQQQQQQQQAMSQAQMQARSMGPGSERAGSVPNGQLQHGPGMHTTPSAVPPQSSSSSPFGTAAVGMQSQQKQLSQGPTASTVGPMSQTAQSYAPSNSPFASSGMQNAPPRGSSVPASTMPSSGNTVASTNPYATMVSGASSNTRPGNNIPASGSGANLSSNLSQQTPVRSGISPATSTDLSRNSYMPSSSVPSSASPAASSQNIAPSMNRFGPASRESIGSSVSQPPPPSRTPFTQPQSANPFGNPPPTTTTTQRTLPTPGMTGGAGSMSGAPTGMQAQYGAPTKQDEEDTMKNLRKTFAGIFGDI